MTWRRPRSEALPEWAVPPVRAVARPEVVAAVAASERLRLGLEGEWRQRALEPGVTHLGGADLLLVEVSDGAVPGFAPEDVTRLVSDARRYDVPLVVWVTSGRPPGDPGPVVSPLLAEARGVFVADLLDEWLPLAPEARILPPAAAPSLAGPRAAKAAIVSAGPQDPASAGAVATLLAVAVQPLVDQVEAHVLDRRVPVAGLLPRSLAASAASSAASAADVAQAVASAAVLVDGPRRSPGDTWSVLEAASAQTAVVTMSGLELPTGLTAPTADDAAGLRAEIVALLNQPELRDRVALAQHRAVHAGHTLGHRVDQILTGLELAAPARRTPTVSAIVPTNRPHEIDNVLANLGRQFHRETELVLVLHGIEVDLADLRARARDRGVPHLEVVTAPSTATLGEALNLGLDAATGDHVAKMDDDNHYGTHYLTDLVNALATSGAGIVGKWAHYVWLRSSGAVVLRYPDAEHTWTRRIQGGAMLFAGDVARGLRFADLPRAVDSDILDRAIADGVKIWSSDRFNFVSVRGHDAGAHTWGADDASFLTAAGRLAFFGDPRLHVEA